MVIELLQEIGLNKYEAEAYIALLRLGPLTGYELGKRSGVPLSRSYEILERLSAKGLALMQPGDPPRYAAEPPAQLIERTRAATTATLDALGKALAEAAQPRGPDGFWVVRGRAPILNQARALLRKAERTILIGVDPAHAAELKDDIAQAQARGRRVTQAPGLPRANKGLLLVIDEREGLAGTLAPADDCDAVTGANPAFVAALSQALTPRLVVMPTREAGEIALSGDARRLDWLDWEERKQRRLLTNTKKERLT